jgi:DHA1 family inner membrane transport protein
MLYVGTALGAIISGSVVGLVGFERLAWVGLPFALLALVTLVFDSRLPAPAREPAPT